MSEQFKVWITKYALSSGIRVEMAELSAVSDSMITVRADPLRKWQTETFHGSDWHRDEQSAIAKCELMRKKKISSLEMQLAKLKKLEFKVTT